VWYKKLVARQRKAVVSPYTSSLGNACDRHQ
jgi:hypothetical protein